MPIKPSNEEYADIHFIYGFCSGNAKASLDEYPLPTVSDI